MDVKQQIETAGKVIDLLAGGWMLAAELAAEKMGVAFDAAALIQRAQMHQVVIEMLTSELSQNLAARDAERNPVLRAVLVHNITNVSKRLAEILAKTGMDQAVADEAVAMMIAPPNVEAIRVGRDGNGRFTKADIDEPVTNGQHN